MFFGKFAELYTHLWHEKSGGGWGGPAGNFTERYSPLNKHQGGKGLEFCYIFHKFLHSQRPTPGSRGGLTAVMIGEHIATISGHLITSPPDT